MWLAHRRGFLAVLSATLFCGLAFPIVRPHLHDADALSALGYVPMGLLLFLTFVFCGFTDSDRRARLTGFPSRLFSLPVSTRTLISTPILFGVVSAGLVYMAWAKLVLPGLGRALPLTWPVLYLLTGMICYQAIIWSMARFKVMRILALGVGGAFFAIGWAAFRNDFERELLSWLVPDTVPVRPILCLLLCALSLGALGTAYVAVESQRHGRNAEWEGWRRWIQFFPAGLAREPAGPRF